MRRRCAMSGATGPSLPDFGEVGNSASLERGRFTYLPVVPGRLEFAVEVRRRILAERPQVVAVELPATLEDAYLDAVKRLPQISVIFYNDTASAPARSRSPAIRLRSRRAGRSVCRSHSQRAGNRRASCLRRSRFHRTPAHRRHLPRHLRPHLDPIQPVRGSLSPLPDGTHS